jgi:diguanylate cyclase (GGDEF)-like protein/putative nucleotidyltransferase with HDIG domain
MSRGELVKERWAVRASVAGLLVVLCFLAGFSMLTQRSVEQTSRKADRAMRVSAIYQDARDWVGEEQSEERRYRFEGSYAVRLTHDAAEKRLAADLQRIRRLDSSRAARATVAQLLDLHERYRDVSHRLFAAVDSGDDAAIQHYDHEVIDPVFGVLEDIVSRQADAAQATALAHSASVRAKGARATRAITVAFGAGLALLASFAAIILRFRRRLDAARGAELARLSEIAISDPLTGLRNHRAFHEDLARELQRVSRTEAPLALVLIDLDDLKAVNDENGHQAGDERLQALAEAIRATQRAGDCAYRVGGDEFAITLPGTRAYGAMEFAQRLRAATQSGEHGVSFTVTAGISEALELRAKDALVREADLALIGAKRVHQEVAIYGPDMERGARPGEAEDEHHSRTLASALARAVDAKDSYTRSHCQTVSQLCAAIATELGFEGDRLARMRLAGLLHDVGKIGVPDAILNKPSGLSDAEYEIMKRHSLLGFDIVQAADMPLEAAWVRHHHERFDGGGYPDGLAGDEIPLESRIVLVADAFEAMTSDRPYRKAPGVDFALAELRRHAGSQFDPAVVAALCRVLDRVEAEPVAA